MQSAAERFAENILKPIKEKIVREGICNHTERHGDGGARRGFTFLFGIDQSMSVVAKPVGDSISVSVISNLGYNEYRTFDLETLFDSDGKGWVEQHVAECLRIILPLIR
jgi:hypothetical protein